VNRSRSMDSASVERAFYDAALLADLFGGRQMVDTKDGWVIRLLVAFLPSMVGPRSDEQKIAEIVNKARSGNADAQAFLCLTAGHLIREDKKVPSVLRGYIASLLMAWASAGSSKRGKGRPKDNAIISRDAFIVSAVEALLAGYAEHGLQATRSRDPSRRSSELGNEPAESACSIVQKTLAGLGIHMSEANVEKIWRHRKKGKRLSRPT
jgi:hypothetical protein